MSQEPKLSDRRCHKCERRIGWAEPDTALNRYTQDHLCNPFTCDVWKVARVEAVDD